MGPASVLLDRYVDICFDEDDDDEAAAAVTRNPKPAARTHVLQYLQESTMACLASMKLDVILADPPGITTFRLRCPKSHEAVGRRDASDCHVACADKSLVVLYAGRYHGPGSNVRGCYLVYDAAATAVPTTSRCRLSTVPPVLGARYHKSIGAGAVVMCRSPPSSSSSSSSYLLAELAMNPERDLPGAELHLWCSDGSPTPQWVTKAVRLPPEVCPAPGKHNFCANTSFSFGASCLCWVDLLHGIVICADPAGQQDPRLRFVPLPDGCPAVGTSDRPYRLRMEEFRSVGCVVGGAIIKLVAIEGLLEGLHCTQFRLVTWTMSPDLNEWNNGDAFCLKDIWARDEYLALKIPRHTPLCPILSASRENVVYAVVNDVDIHKIFLGSEHVETKVDVKGQYVLELDMQRNSIVSTSCGHPACVMQAITRRLLATDFAAYLMGAKDHQVECFH